MSPPQDPLTGLVSVAGVDAAAGRARAAIDAMLRHRVLRRRGEVVGAESVLRGAWAASGTSASLADVRAGRVADPQLQRALRVYGELPALAATWAAAPRQALARMHALAAAGTDPELLGRPVDRPAAARLDVLAEVLHTTRAPAAVIAAVVRGELLATDAFAPVTAVVANAALRLVLVTSGLDPSSRSVPEVGVRERSALEPALVAAYVTGEPAALTAWIDHVVEVIVLGARETVAISEALQR